MRQLGSFFVEEAAPGFGAFSGVAVGAEADSVEDSVVSSSDSWDAVVELEVDLAEILGVAVGVGAAAALPAPKCVSQLVVGEPPYVFSARLRGVTASLACSSRLM